MTTLKDRAQDEMQINLLGVRLRINGPSEIIEPLRSSLFTRCIEPVGHPPDAHVRVVSDERGFHVFHADKEGEEIFRGKNRSRLFWWLDDVLFKKSLKRSYKLIQVHGGAVERGGRAILFFGSSYAGKSTMTLHLIRRGWRFLTDEVILVDPDTRRVKPFLRNLLIRQGAVENDPILRKQCSGHWHYEDYHGEGKWLVDPAVVGGEGEAQEAEVERIYCLLRDSERPPLLERVGERQVVEEMIRQAFNNDCFIPKSVDAIVRIVRQSQNYRIRAPHGGEAWKLLRRHMNLQEG